MRVGVLTGGGDCPGLNAVIRAVVRKGIGTHGFEFVGFRDGWKGPLEGLTMELGIDQVHGILPRGGTILGSSRTNPFKVDGGVERIQENLEKHNVDALIAIGGEDTLGVATKLDSLGVNVVGVPKTIDNDLNGTDFTFGFDTAVQIATEAIDRLHTTAESHHRVMVCEVMGRHAGWIAAAAGLAADEETDLPVVILFPEIVFAADRFLARVERAVRRYGYCSVVVSEGVRDADGHFLSDQGLRDAFGHAQLGGVAPVIAQLIKQGLGLKYHWAVADYLQRAARHVASKTDVLQAYATGKAAVEVALKGRNSVMPAIKRVSNRPYKWKIEIAELKHVANKEKFMPRDFISEDGFGITAKCRQYLTPLIQGEDYPPYKNGLPQYVRLKNVGVKKKLGEFKL